MGTINKKDSGLPRMLSYLRHLKSELSPRGRNLIDALRRRIHAIEKNEGTVLDRNVVLDASIQEVIEKDGLKSPDRRKAFRYAIAVALGSGLRPKGDQRGPLISDIQMLLSRHTK